jgi:hypothetical protein
MTLWAEGPPTATAEGLAAYYAGLVRFVAHHNIDRVIVRVMDPAVFKWYAPDALPSSASFLRDFLALLPSTVVVLALPAVSTKDSTWVWRPMVPGNVEGLNAAHDAPTDGGCTNPANREAITWERRAEWPQFPRCPNTVEQASTWLAEINAAAAAANVATRVSGFVFDLEGGGLYRETDAMVSAVRDALSRYSGRADATVGMTGSYRMDGIELGVDEAFPQAYWMGELAKTGCTPSLSAASGKECGAKTIYRTTKDDPAKLMKTWATKYIIRADADANGAALVVSGGSVNGTRGASSTLTSPRRTYLLSVEQLECESHSPTCGCVNKLFASKAGCGSFDGFGVWCPRPFRSFVAQLAKKYSLESIGLFQYNEMPLSWRI